jgi:hypothetical protein
MSRRTSPALDRWASLGFYLAAIAWFIVIAFGLVLVSTPETGRHSHVMGWTALVIGFLILVTTTDRWIRYAQVFLGCGIIGGLVTLARGHMPGNQAPFPRTLAAVLVLLLVGCSLIVGTLAKRRLRAIDRVGLVAFVAAFTGALAPGTQADTMIRLAVGLGILLALWGYHRYRDIDDKAASRRPC